MSLREVVISHLRYGKTTTARLILEARIDEVRRAIPSVCLTCAEGVPVFVDEDGDLMHTAAQYCDAPALHERLAALTSSKEKP